MGFELWALSDGQLCVLPIGNRVDLFGRTAGRESFSGRPARSAYDRGGSAEVSGFVQALDLAGRGLSSNARSRLSQRLGLTTKKGSLGGSPQLVPSNPPRMQIAMTARFNYTYTGGKALLLLGLGFVVGYLFI